MKKSVLLLGNTTLSFGGTSTVLYDFQKLISEYLKEIGYEVHFFSISPAMLNRSLGMIKRLLQDDLVIANLSSYGPDVYYQLGVRHLSGKPTIHFIHEGQTVFDLSDPNFCHIVIEHLHSQEDFRAKLIFATLGYENNKYLPSYYDYIDMVGERQKHLEDRLYGNTLANAIQADLSVSTFVERRLAKNELVKRQKI